MSDPANDSNVSRHLNGIPLPQPLKAILFDLDGTLADTALDLATAINAALSDLHLPTQDPQHVGKFASGGVKGLLSGAGITPEHKAYHELCDRFYSHYASALCVHTKLFEGVQTLLEKIETKGLQWGIVTNKHSRYALPLIEQLGLDMAQVVVCGDSTPHPKPAPDPLLLATKKLNIKRESIIYVGDDIRDIQSAKAAEIYSVVAAYGYCIGDPPITWGANDIIQSPLALNSIIKLALSAD